MNHNVHTLMTAEMRRHWIRAVLGSRQLSTAAKTVLIALETFADYRDGTNAHPGEVLLAEICGLSTRAVRSALARGRELEFIEQTGSANSRAGLATVYRLLPAPPSAATTGTPVPAIEPTTGTPVPVNNSTTGTATTPRPERPRHHDRNGGSAHPPCTLQVPTGLSESGTSPEQPLAAHTDRAPSRFCDNHPLGYRGKCPDCANSRTAFEAWQGEQVTRDVAIAQADELARRRRRQLIDDCEACDDWGRVSLAEDDDGGRGEDLAPCPHPPEARRRGYG